jgi:hypothetical protein
MQQDFIATEVAGVRYMQRWRTAEDAPLLNPKRSLLLPSTQKRALLLPLTRRVEASGGQLLRDAPCHLPHVQWRMKGDAMG